ncbi:MAG TPA: hypothetical protein VFR28_02190 [Allosphingosinicella sp.]|nr:hypothetical protein [Allosphingosinicella sp.]
MRHDQIHAKDSYDRIDVAAVWPVGIQVAPLPVPDLVRRDPAEPFEPTPSAPDVAAGVGRLIVAAYCGLIAAFAAATAGSGESLFAIAIAALFLAAFFTVPRLILAQELESGPRPSFERFLAEGMETLTGHSSGGAALVQMLIVPVFLTFGILAIGVAAAFIL